MRFLVSLWAAIEKAEQRNVLNYLRWRKKGIRVSLWCGAQWPAFMPLPWPHIRAAGVFHLDRALCFTLSTSWMIAFSATGIKKKEKVLQDKSLSRWPVTRYMNHLYYGCDHGCCQRWFIPWWPHGSLTALPPGRLPGIHRDLSETPAVPPFCRRPQVRLPPLGFKPTIVSLRNNLILKSKVRNSKRSGTAHALSGDLQKDNEITKSLSDIFS